jgi:hypothetical protein
MGETTETGFGRHESKGRKEEEGRNGSSQNRVSLET